MACFWLYAMGFVTTSAKPVPEHSKVCKNLWFLRRPLRGLPYWPCGPNEVGASGRPAESGERQWFRGEPGRRTNCCPR